MENPAKPMSDEALMKALASQGVKVARRTAARYREQPGILPSHLRRSFPDAAPKRLSPSAALRMLAP